MIRSLIFAPEAAAEFGELLAYVAAQDPATAASLRVRVERTLDLLARGLCTGREVHLKSGETVRRWVVPPLVLYYQSDTTELRVVRILRGTRAPIEG